MISWQTSHGDMLHLSIARHACHERSCEWSGSEGHGLELVAIRVCVCVCVVRRRRRTLTLTPWGTAGEKGPPAGPWEQTRALFGWAYAGSWLQRAND